MSAIHLAPPLHLLSPTPSTPSEATTCCSFSPDGSKAVVNAGAELICWNVPEVHAGREPVLYPKVAWRTSLAGEALPTATEGKNTFCDNSVFLKSLPRPPGLPTSIYFTASTLLVGTSSGLVLVMYIVTGEIYSFSTHTSRFLTSALESCVEDSLDLAEAEESLPEPPKGTKTSSRRVSNANQNQFMTPNTVYTVTSNRSGTHFAACGEDGRTTLHKFSDMSQCGEMYCREDVADDDLDADDFVRDSWFEQRGYMQR